MQTYSFGVIVPTYNRYELLERCLRSLAQQTCKDFCCVIVDDGSDELEKVKNIVAQYEKDMEILFHAIGSNKGISHARNMGAKLVREKVRYISFLDSDDEFTPHAIEVRKKMLKKHPDSECLVTGYVLVGSPFVKDRDHPERLIHVNQCGLPGRGNCTPQLSLEIESFFRIGMFTETGLYGEDIDIVDRCKSFGLRKRLSRTPTYIYHREPHDEVTNLL